MKREDAYIFKCIEDESFAVDYDFCKYFRMHPRIRLFYERVLLINNQGPYGYADRVLSLDSDLYIHD